MIEANPKQLVKVRCKNEVYIKTDGKPFICNNLLAEIEEGTGMIVCRRCKHQNYFDIRNSKSRQWYNEKVEGGQPQTSTLRVPTK